MRLRLASVKQNQDKSPSGFRILSFRLMANGLLSELMEEPLTSKFLRLRRESSELVKLSMQV